MVSARSLHACLKSFLRWLTVFRNLFHLAFCLVCFVCLGFWNFRQFHLQFMFAVVNVFSDKSAVYWMTAKEALSRFAALKQKELIIHGKSQDTLGQLQCCHIACLLALLPHPSARHQVEPSTGAKDLRDCEKVVADCSWWTECPLWAETGGLQMVALQFRNWVPAL